METAGGLATGGVPSRGGSDAAGARARARESACGGFQDHRNHSIHPNPRRLLTHSNRPNGARHVSLWNAQVSVRSKRSNPDRAA